MANGLDASNCRSEQQLTAPVVSHPAWTHHRLPGNSSRHIPRIAGCYYVNLFDSPQMLKSLFDVKTFDLCSTFYSYPQAFKPPKVSGEHILPPLIRISNALHRPQR